MHGEGGKLVCETNNVQELNRECTYRKSGSGDLVRGVVKEEDVAQGQSSFSFFQVSVYNTTQGAEGGGASGHETPLPDIVPPACENKI